MKVQCPVVSGQKLPMLLPLTRALATFLHQFVKLLLVQMLHHFTNVLSVLKSSNQQCIRSFYHHQIAHAHGRDKLARSVHVVAAGIQNEHARAVDQVAIRRIALRV